MRLLLSIIPRLAAALSRSFPGALALMVRLWILAVRAKFHIGTPRQAVRFWYAGKAFTHYLEGTVDIAALYEIYVLKEYGWELGMEPRVIIDLGAHFGDTAMYYHLRYPDARILAVEPSPESYARLLETVNGIPEIAPIHAAVGDHDGTAQLHIGSSSLGASLIKRKDATAAVEVPMHTLPSLLEANGLQAADLIKFDIEGGEQYMFVLRRPEELSTAYIGEVHSDLMDITAEEFQESFGPQFETSLEKLSNPHRFIFTAIRK